MAVFELGKQTEALETLRTAETIDEAAIGRAVTQGDRAAEVLKDPDALDTLNQKGQAETKRLLRSEIPPPMCYEPGLPGSRPRRRRLSDGGRCGPGWPKAPPPPMHCGSCRRTIEKPDPEWHPTGRA
ncbi:MAG: hypothetical protein ACLFV7_13170 [Phycisphaerae bacterium]